MNDITIQHNRALLKKAYGYLGDFLEAVPKEKDTELAIAAVVNAAEFISAALRNYPPKK